MCLKKLEVITKTRVYIDLYKEYILQSVNISKY